jgi:DNA polymerase (family 10)
LLATLAGIRGDVAEAAVFTRAAVIVREQQIASDADLSPLLDTSADDPSRLEIDRRLRYMYETGAWVVLESAIADLPSDLRWLLESGAVTIDQLAALHQALDATSAADLAEAVERGAVRAVAGLDAVVEYAIAAALLDLRALVRRISLGRATSLTEPILALLRASSGVEWALPAGSLRRGQETVGDVEIVASATDPQEAIDTIVRLPDLSRCLLRNRRKVYVLLGAVQVGIRFPNPATAGAALLALTGTAAHVRRLKKLAAQGGWTLDTEGLHSADRSQTVGGSEEEIYAALGLPFIPPEIREGEEEFVAAQQGTLPTLVTRADIRGDLHMHSSYSDGNDSVDAMVDACRSLGYEYMAVTDHSPHSSASRSLSVRSATRQAEEIAALRERHPAVTILHGCEVDILPGGRLDFTDRILERFDLVLASLHEGAGASAEELLRRYASAMRHPLVNVITHPTNRLVPHKPGYDLDYTRLFEIAVETGTVLEIDGSPAHLDLDGGLARRAIAAGATLAICSDSHRAQALDRQMRLGILTARRGWVEPRHVLNTLPLAELREAIARKRR